VEEFGGEGVFWLEGSKEHMAAGTLSFSEEDGIKLDLIGSLALGFTEPMKNERIRIHGIAGKRLVTIFDCMQSNWNLQAPGIIRESYVGSMLIAGGHITDEMPMEFKSLVFEATNLTPWVCRSGLTFSITAPEVGPPERVSWEFVPLKPDRAVMADGSKVEVGFTWSVGGDRVNDAYLNQGTYVEVIWPESRPIERVFGTALSVRDLLSLASHSSCDLVNLRVRHEGILTEHDPERLESLTLFARFDSGRQPEVRQHWDLLFNCEQFGGVEGVAKWLDSADELRPVLGSLLTLRHAESMYEENRMQNVALAAESLHRIRFANEVSPPEEHAKRIAAILNAVPENEQKWLRDRLTYSNEPNLRRRLRELAECAGDPFTEFVGDPKRWCYVVASTRNRLTHYSGTNPKLEGLRFLSESLYALVALAVLRLSGADDDLLRAFVSNKHIAWLRPHVQEALKAN
jgi:hypothetical protein